MDDRKWACEQCKSINEPGVKVCTKCEAKAPGLAWTCSSCRCLNSFKYQQCVACGATKGAKDSGKKTDQIRCPACNSSQISANQKGFGLGKAAAGGLLLGPVGLLGGMVGSKKIKLTCLNCGKTWKPGMK